VRAPSRSVAALERSGIRELTDLALGRGGDVIRLELGEPDFPTPPHVLEAAARAAADGFTKYTANRGLSSLREAICAKLAARNGLSVEPEQVVVTTGGVTGIFEALAVLVERGEQVLVPDPGWPNYAMAAATLGAEPVRYPLVRADGFQPDLDALARLARRPRAKAIVVNSPSNPTGAVWPRATLEGVLGIARERDLYVVSDEVYEELVFEGEHVSPAGLDGDGRVVTVFSFSKTYAMTGWRVGYAVGARPVSDLIAKAQEAIVACAPGIAQKAAEAALAGPQSCVAEMRAAYRRRRDRTVAALRRCGCFVTEPRGTFYVLADVGRAERDTYAFARRLLADEGVAVAPGEAFGRRGAGLVRISVATAPDALEEGVARLARAVEAAAPLQAQKSAATAE
jgi:aspartate aminotransferase/aminotransferase